jgi:hypothetical protein
VRRRAGRDAPAPRPQPSASAYRHACHRPAESGATVALAASARALCARAAWPYLGASPQGPPL